MARKIPLHLDAAVAMVIVFMAAMAFIGYQRHEYQAVAQENVDRRMTQVQLELRLARLEGIEKKCASKEP